MEDDEWETMLLRKCTVQHIVDYLRIAGVEAAPSIFNKLDPEACRHVWGSLRSPEWKESIVRGISAVMSDALIPHMSKEEFGHYRTLFPPNTSPLAKRWRSLSADDRIDWLLESPSDREVDQLLCIDLEETRALFQGMDTDVQKRLRIRWHIGSISSSNALSGNEANPGVSDTPSASASKLTDNGSHRPGATPSTNLTPTSHMHFPPQDVNIQQSLERLLVAPSDKRLIERPSRFRDITSAAVQPSASDESSAFNLSASQPDIGVNPTSSTQGIRRVAEILSDVRKNPLNKTPVLFGSHPVVDAPYSEEEYSEVAMPPKLHEYKEAEHMERLKSTDWEHRMDTVPYPAKWMEDTFLSEVFDGEVADMKYWVLRLVRAFNLWCSPETRRKGRLIQAESRLDPIPRIFFCLFFQEHHEVVKAKGTGHTRNISRWNAELMEVFHHQFPQHRPDHPCRRLVDNRTPTNFNPYKSFVRQKTLGWMTRAVNSADEVKMSRTSNMKNHDYSKSNDYIAGQTNQVTRATDEPATSTPLDPPDAFDVRIPEQLSDWDGLHSFIDQDLQSDSMALEAASAPHAVTVVGWIQDPQTGELRAFREEYGSLVSVASLLHDPKYGQQLDTILKDWRLALTSSLADTVDSTLASTADGERAMDEELELLSEDGAPLLQLQSAGGPVSAPVNTLSERLQSGKTSERNTQLLPVRSAHSSPFGWSSGHLNTAGSSRKHPLEAEATVPERPIKRPYVPPAEWPTPSIYNGQRTRSPSKRKLGVSYLDELPNAQKPAGERSSRNGWKSLGLGDQETTL